MACPACGCKETYEYDEEDSPDDTWERCAACGVVFDIEDHTPEDDDAAMAAQSQKGGAA